jgi:hypothetical protein
MVLLKIVNYHTSVSIKPINNHHHRLIIILLIHTTQKLLIRILITFYDFSEKLSVLRYIVYYAFHCPIARKYQNGQSTSKPVE